MTHIAAAAAAFNSHADAYDPARRRLVPCYDRFYGTVVEACRLTGDPSRILDLGAGTGLLAGHLRHAFPAAELTLLDGAPRMLELARVSLGQSGIRYQVGDLTEPLPEGPWDAIVSALAIHHLDDEHKRALMARVYAALRPGGVFANAEQVLGPGPGFTAMYSAWHEAAARAAGSDDAEWSGATQRMAHDRCATVEDQLAWLRDAGFAEVDCLFKDHRFAVMVAVR